MNCVGVLALQGCIEPHVTMLKKLGVDALRVRSKEQLSQIDRLILPGGESTTMLKFLKQDEFFEDLRTFSQTHPVWGVCAGSILLAQKVLHPVQESLGVIPIQAHRNFYGSQLDSFKTSLYINPLQKEIPVDFIRAPLLSSLSDSVLPIASYNGNAVCFLHKNVLVSAFHTELGSDPSFHKYFLSLS